MHPAGITFKGLLLLPEAPPPYRDAWEKQRCWVFQTAVDGCQWGTIVPELGSEGNTGRTIAAPKLTGREGEHLLSG